jgi:hypothetical protein
MRPAPECHAGTRHRVLAVVGLGLMFQPAALLSPVAGSASTPGQPQVLSLTTPDGDLIHAITYRPAGAPSQGVVLTWDGPRAQSPSDSQTGTECWHGFPEELCLDGSQVLVPDLVGQDLAGGVPYGPEPEPTQLAPVPGASLAVAEALTGALGDSIGTLGLVCMGSSGRMAPLLAQSDPRITAIVWILPAGDAGVATAWDLPSDRPVRLLLIASEKRAESLALAGDLYTRFNRMCELWLLDWGESGCALLASAHERGVLRAWLAAVAPSGDPDAGAPGPTSEEGSGKEPG